jgi:hypothetical protein
MRLAKTRALRVHFFHIGKTGGNTIKEVISHSNNRQFKVQFEYHPHNHLLAEISLGEAYLVAVRHPVERFVSGFYSRKREGRPKNNAPHSAGESEAFQIFPHASDLAEALTSKSAITRKAARAAFSSIRHVNTEQRMWFGGNLDFLSTHPPVGILRTQHLSSDLRKFFRGIGIPGPVIASTPLRRHENPKGEQIPLTKSAKNNLLAHYRMDVAFYEGMLSSAALVSSTKWSVSSGPHNERSTNS